MNTKSTICSGDNFHFYNEGFDEGSVYLELEEAEWEYSAGRVMIRIPDYIWETIRKRPSPLGNEKVLTDEEIEKYCREFVAQRIEDVKAAKIAGLFGCLAFGSVDDPVETQVEYGIAYYKERRKKIEESKAKIK